MNSNDIIIKPVISEKTTEMMEHNKYVFQVAMKANKLQVTQAIKDIYGVKPKKINMLIVRGKDKRLRFRLGRTSAWKKAIVTLKPGEKIEIFDVQ
ncbi:MAG TPA: 50S ribosomal protein L23 [Spirochaetota bacterium]|nr:50S ribosomal protein L23 [Spirochaetota bacterium]HRZ25322.1 50S ribosomal protein L23 [Spirochaetota bacterium]HSA15411.1 50S ribosomal protein L23 [Spirochaetota bacterium]